jgi:uncharacterized protein (TIGR02246 family)
MRKFLMVTLVALVFSAPGYAQDNATVQRLADQFAEAFNKNSAAGVGDMYTDEAVLIPPEADTRMGRRDIQAFWTQQAREAENLTVTLLDVKPIGPDAARAVLRSEVTPKGPRAQHVTARNVIVLQKVGADWKVSTHTWNYDRPVSRFRDDDGRGYARPDRLEEERRGRDQEDRYERRSERDGWRSGRGDRDYSGRERYRDHHWDDDDRHERRYWRD